jgi:hypothetical protein
MGNAAQQPSAASPTREQPPAQPPDLSELGKQLMRKATSGVADDAAPRAQGPDVARLEAPICADCVDGAYPQWVSMAYGTTVCSLCAGAHRGLGTTNVRSLCLDQWTREQVDDVLFLGGNDAINEALEWWVARAVRGLTLFPRRHVPAAFGKPRANVTSGEERRLYIKAKYVDAAFAKSRGQPRQAAQAAALGLGVARPRSFNHGKLELVGVIDVVIEEARQLARPSMFRSRHLSGGYRVVARLGSQRFETRSSVQGDFTKSLLHLSWDGVSDLGLELLLGHLLMGEAVLDLGFLLHGPRSAMPVRRWVEVTRRRTSSSHLSLSGSLLVALSFVDLR